ncbi:hypothetical protein T265_00931 [Opisthorchis viverrini]|uniref:Uncharacterized protein n=1 Tax=Opisthorchis viverrini TaxID=6198 RepID=A0A075AJE5_OPIVI|nr:hypothetical protein T265_00931 [Opisthorchis viverrini]KER33244.1 hypothetical protein T265_00931 [Opisthorchis viverrini]
MWIALSGPSGTIHLNSDFKELLEVSSNLVVSADETGTAGLQVTPQLPAIWRRDQDKDADPVATTLWIPTGYCKLTDMGTFRIRISNVV